jgi:hypothetical protein
MFGLTPAQQATPPLRPYDLRHSGVTWRLNSGVPPTEVAAWATAGPQPRMGETRNLLGRVWDVEGVRSWRFLSQAGINDDRTVRLFHRRSAVFALLTVGAPVVPPVGFEPTHTALEAASAIHRIRALTCLRAHAAQLCPDIVPRIFRIMKVAPLLPARSHPAVRALRRMACSGLTTTRCLARLWPAGVALSKVGGACRGVDH